MNSIYELILDRHTNPFKEFLLKSLMRFSRVFPDEVYQRRIINAINNNQLREARTLLDNLPHAGTDKQVMDKLIMLSEGYKLIIGKYEDFIKQQYTLTKSILDVTRM